MIEILQNPVRETDDDEFEGYNEDEFQDYSPEVEPKNSFTDNLFWERKRGAIKMSDGQLMIGRVGAPPQQEATSSKFCFWIPADALVERGQIVICESSIADETYKYYALVEEVHRRSRRKSMEDEVNLGDNDLETDPPFKSEGYTFATVSILRVEPPVQTPPREWSPVFLANAEEASQAYGSDEIDPESKLALGLIKNGGVQLSGPGFIDLDYLLGANGGHMNVTGAAGRGTKSSFLLFTVWRLLANARDYAQLHPGELHPRAIVPIILNVKNFDLFYIDHATKRFDPTKHASTWHELGITDPHPFQNVRFLAAQKPKAVAPVDTGRLSGVKPFSWSLSDIIADGLFSYLFAENDLNFSALALDVENWLIEEKQNGDGSTTISLAAGRPTNFKTLLEKVKNQKTLELELPGHHPGTWKKFYRRLLKMVYEGKGVLHGGQQGNPLRLTAQTTTDPVVVDLAALAGLPELQRFVVAAIFHQLKIARTGENAVKNLVYLVVLDELNRFAPRGARDSITELIETIAAEMRSQGIILLGAQQQASRVSERIFENSAIKVLGKTGSVELNSTVWNFLSAAAKFKAQNLQLDEKLIIQDNFREPMLVKVPFPAWAMNPNEAVSAVEEKINETAKTNLDEFLQPD